MSLHTEWMRFKRECLTGRSRDEIAAAKDMWYAGALTATDAITRLLVSDSPGPVSQAKARCIGAIVTEARAFQAAVMRRKT